MLTDIRIHGPWWDAALPERRREWRQLIAEMLEQHPSGGEGALCLTITPGLAEGTLLELCAEDGMMAGCVLIAMAALAPHFREYLDICQRMAIIDEGSHSARLEALDMAKKVAHDRAAQTLLGLGGPLLPDHATARCLFTLLISLHFDTGRMLRGHRVTPG